MTEKIISRGECSRLPATPWSNLSVGTTRLGRGLYSTGWSNLSVETAHLSRGSYSTGQSHERHPVVRGLLSDRAQSSKPRSVFAMSATP